MTGSDPDDTITITVHCTRNDAEALDRVVEEMRGTLSASFAGIESGLTREAAALVLIRAGIAAHKRAEAAHGH